VTQSRNEDKLQVAIKVSKNLMVPWYLISSYAYYQLDQPIISDQAFDNLAKEALANWPTLVHRHKGLISEDELKAGTLLLERDRYPGIVVSLAESMANGV